MSQPFGPAWGAPPPGPYAPVRQDRAPVWPGLVVAGAALLLLVAVLLPWVRVTAGIAGRQVADESVNGLGDGVTWGWPTLLCALAAGALGVTGAVLRSGRLAGAAIIPGVLALGSLLAVALRLQYTEERALHMDPRIPQALQDLLGRQIHVSLDIGWFLALLMTLVVIGGGVAAFATARR
ncbi:hypothetical protein [Actinomadura macrotermitis]|uniref:Uncharacterized protein n=1 Tax=Actinomadura macrotermitis TaxID=2585200 RepID=A0A7K0BXG2_9ACTN|nr:hypothetical protein [Actinomadura macrotermitis]MQY05542.1 hypothetical protein [Actinomadura macrotermitis]